MNKTLMLGALGCSLVIALVGHAAPRKTTTVDTRVGKVDIVGGKVRAALLSGANQGVLPGDHGYFVKDGQRVPGTDFEVFKVGDRVSWTDAPFPTLDAMRATSLDVRLSATRGCSNGGSTVKGTMPAKITSTAKESDTTLTFAIDRGSDDAVLPSSAVHAVSEATGERIPIAMEITWVTRTSAGGFVREVKDVEGTSRTLRRVVVERVGCAR